MRIGRLKSNTAVAHAARHNLREYDPHNVDRTRTEKNENLLSQSREQVVAKLDERLKTVDRKVRKDAVRAVEYVVTRSPEATKTDDLKYFNDTLKWLQNKHGRENLLSVTLHLDEDTPHLHAIVVPIVKVERKGKTVNSLSAKHFFSGKKTLSDLQTDFYEKVGKGVGLERGIMRSGAKHIPLKEFYHRETMLTDKNVTIPWHPKKRKQIAQNIEGTIRREYARGMSEKETEANQYRFAAAEMERERNKVIDYARNLEKKIDRLENPEKYRKKERSREKDREIDW